MQEIILKSLRLFQEDLDKDNYAGMLCQEEDLAMRVKDKKALSLAFPKHYGDLNLCQEEGSKMSVKDRSRVLCELRQNISNEKKEEEVERVPFEWPLPKEERLGENLEDEIVSPEEFSQNLVGGRGGF